MDFRLIDSVGQGHGVVAVIPVEARLAGAVGDARGVGPPLGTQCLVALAGRVDREVAVQQRRFGAAPVRVGPETPHQDALHRRVREGRAVEVLQEVGPEVFVAVGVVVLGDPDGQVEVRQGIEPPGDLRHRVVAVRKVALHADAVDVRPGGLQVGDLAQVGVEVVTAGDDVVVIDEGQDFRVGRLHLVEHVRANGRAQTVLEERAVQHLVVDVPVLVLAVEMSYRAGDAGVYGVHQTGIVEVLDPLLHEIGHSPEHRVPPHPDAVGLCEIPDLVRVGVADRPLHGFVGRPLGGVFGHGPVVVVANPGGVLGIIQRARGDGRAEGEIDCRHVDLHVHAGGRAAAAVQYPDHGIALAYAVQAAAARGENGGQGDVAGDEVGFGVEGAAVDGAALPVVERPVGVGQRSEHHLRIAGVGAFWRVQGDGTRTLHLDRQGAWWRSGPGRQGQQAHHNRQRGHCAFHDGTESMLHGVPLRMNVVLPV